ncbi:FAS1-like dehydratase domain-containing protein [Rhodococcus sp. IEGM1428]|uniref:FAS1-like dehydratase domain-containing protein n=1 Tax=Rhodococcus sp. IEGM1428 TaxID=3392191 RepID=UPI003D0F567C
MSGDGAGSEYGTAVGTYQDGLAFVGRVGVPRFAEEPVEVSGGRGFAAAVHDGNPLWWDVEFAAAVAGGPVVPPATLVKWGTGRHWSPAVSTESDFPGASWRSFLVTVPLPTDSMINLRSEIEFFDYLRAGDVINVTEVVESLSEEKQTGVGPGYFLTVVAWYRRANGDPIALQRNVMLRFRTGEQQ